MHIQLISVYCKRLDARECIVKMFSVCRAFSADASGGVFQTFSNAEEERHASFVLQQARGFQRMCTVLDVGKTSKY